DVRAGSRHGGLGVGEPAVVVLGLAAALLLALTARVVGGHHVGQRPVAATGDGDRVADRHDLVDRERTGPAQDTVRDARPAAGAAPAPPARRLPVVRRRPQPPVRARVAAPARRRDRPVVAVHLNDVDLAARDGRRHLAVGEPAVVVLGLAALLLALTARV